MRVGSYIVEPSLVHGHAAMADMQALRGGYVVMPEHVAGARIDSPDMVRHGEIENAVDHQRRRFDLGALIGLKGPGKSEFADILRCDLGEMAVPFAGIVAVIERPAIGCRMLDL